MPPHQPGALAPIHCLGPLPVFAAAPRNRIAALQVAWLETPKEGRR